MSSPRFRPVEPRFRSLYCENERPACGKRARYWDHGRLLCAEHNRAEAAAASSPDGG